jgi:hypothetical protein
MLSSKKHATLVEKIEDCYLEGTVGGLDARPFESTLYLSTNDMSVCYWAQLQAKDEVEKKN